MARKTMLSFRLHPVVAAKVDELAAGAGQTRTEWLASTVARAALTGSGSPQPVVKGVDEAAPVDTAR